MGIAEQIRVCTNANWLKSSEVQDVMPVLCQGNLLQLDLYFYGQTNARHTNVEPQVASGVDNKRVLRVLRCSDETTTSQVLILCNVLTQSLLKQPHLVGELNIRQC